MVKTLIKDSVVTGSGKVVKKKSQYVYTEQFVYRELESMIELIMANDQIQSKAQLFALKPYSPSKFSGWRQKYASSKRIGEKLLKIENLLEARLVTRGLRDPRVTGFIIFLLKNHYGYQDKREVETETTYHFKVTRGDLRALKAKKLPAHIDLPKQ